MVERASAQRTWRLLAVVAALLIVAGVVWAVVAAGSGAPPAPAATASSSPAGSATATPTASATAPPSAPATSPAATAPATAAPTGGSPIAPEAPPVAPDEVAEQGDVEVELVRVEHVDGQAIAPGEIAGPAIRLTIEVRNGRDAAIDAGLIAVNAYFGDDRSPASSLMQPGGDPFGGSIAPGAAARGVYLFEAGSAELSETLIGVDVLPGERTFTFRGDLR